MIYKKVNDFIICPLPTYDEIDMEQVELIVENTHNTWQSDRKKDEIRENTIQGKRAEIVMERLLAENCNARFMAYDSFRGDGFKKHAPFDGIVYSNRISDNVLNEVIARINRDVQNCPGDSGIISIASREYMEDRGVYTIEIKSSLLQDPRDYKTMMHKGSGDRTESDYQELCKYIAGFYDYFVYPHFCRDNLHITRFYEYTKYVRINKKIEVSTNKQKFLYELMKVEFDNACNIYTRVFFDTISNELMIPGYVLKERFFEEPRIQKMPSQKSKNAIYYMYHMKYGKPILDIDKDSELWNRDRKAARAHLLGAYKPLCPTCGGELRTVETTSNMDDRKHKFLYICDVCPGQTKWVDFYKIHSTNMSKDM